MFNPSRRHLSLIISSLAAVCGILILSWVNGGGRRGHGQSAGGEGAFAAMSTVPLVTQSELREVLFAAPVYQPELASRSERNQLLELAQEFLYHRFVQRSPGEYRKWREGTGASLMSKSELIEEWSIDRAYERYTRRPLPAAASTSELFDEFFQLGTAFGSGENRPRAIISDRAGAAVAFGIVSRANPAMPQFAGEVPRDMWVGSQAVRMRSWHHERAEYSDLLASHPDLLAATVAVVLEYESGRRRPMFLFYVQDPEAAKWTLQSVSVTNPGDAQISALEY